MGSKRSPEDDGHSTTKRRREHAPYKPGKSASNIDQAYGQKGAFGSLEEDRSTVPAWDSDLDCEDDSDALAYLRSVRTQASSIPHIVVAQKAGPLPPPPRLSAGTTEQEDGDEDTVDRSIYGSGIGDSRGYYHDGAYTALPEDYNEVYDEDYEGEESDEDEQDRDGEDSLGSSEGRPHNSSSDEIRDAYYAALTRQYLSLRKIVRTDPPQSVINALPSSNPTQVGKLSASSSTFARWSGLIKATDPLPAQIAAMHKDSIIRLIRILLDGKSFREGHELRERTSRWIWALLARLPDRGELDYQEIGWIRELGKKAVLFMLNLTEREVLQKQYGIGNGSGSSEQDAEVEGAESNLEAPTPSSPDDNIDTSSKAEINETEADGATNIPKDNTAEPQGTPVDANSKSLRDQHCPDPTSQQTIAPSADANADVEHSSWRPPSVPTRAEPKQETAEVSDVEMQLDSDMEDGEVSEESPQEEEIEADIESAKARLLAHPQVGKESSPEPALTQEQEETARAQINLRATLNMILTVAGEFYGQRDLLEFRNPFSKLSED